MIKTSMHMQRKSTLLLRTTGALALLFLLPAGLLAQDSNPRVEVFGGGSFLKGDRTFIVDGTPKETDYAKGGIFGARFTVDLNSHLAVEGAYGGGTNNLRVFDRVTPVVERGFGTRVHRFTGNGLYYFGDSKASLRPFVTAGVGLTRFSPSSKAKSSAALAFIDDPAPIDANSKFGFNFGGGVESKFNNSVGLRFDVRDHLASIPRYGVPQVPTPGVADFYPVSGWVNDWETSVGIVFYLGRR